MDREKFKNRLKQYKKAREENPGLKYWEWKDIPKYDEGTKSVGEQYYKPESVESILAKTAVQLADPTGVSSYPDVWYSGKEFFNDPSWGKAGDVGVNIISALPLIGKVTAPFKAAKMAKLLARIEDANALVKSVENVNRVNKTIDTVTELIPVVRRGAEKVQDVTSSLIVDPIFNYMTNQNKLDLVRNWRNMNATIDGVNIVNNTADVTQGMGALMGYAEGGEVEDPIQNPILPQSHDPYYTQWQANWLNNRRKQLSNNLDNMTYDHRQWLFKSDEDVKDDIRKGGYDVKRVDDNMFKDFGRLLMGYSPERIRVNEEFYRQLNNSATAPETTLNAYDSKYAGVYVKPNIWNNTGHYIGYVKNTTLSDKVHERTHASHADPQKDAISKIINYDKKTLKGRDKYLKDPSEIYSRLMEYRHNNKLNPSLIISTDYLNTHREQLKLHQLDMFTDDQLLNMFNNVAENTVEENRTHKSKRT